MVGRSKFLVEPTSQSIFQCACEAGVRHQLNGFFLHRARSRFWPNERSLQNLKDPHEIIGVILVKDLFGHAISAPKVTAVGD
jgi:hypothetical protein